MRQPTPRRRCRCPPRSATRTRRRSTTTWTRSRTQLLTDDPNVSGDPGEVLGSTQQARANAVFRGGLKIYTTYDPTLQFAASASVNSILPKSQFTASLVVIDNTDGGVRAIANGRSFADMQFDPATEGPGRQAGSSFKVFTLAAALVGRLHAERHGVRRAAALAHRTRDRLRRVLQPGSRRLPRRHDPRSPRRSPSPTTARSCAPSCRSAPATSGTTACKVVIDDRQGNGHQHVELRSRSCRPRSAPTACTRSRWRRRTRCSPNDGILQPRDVRHEDRRRERQGHLSSAERGHACARPERRPHRDADARRAAAPRHRRADARQLPPTVAGKTGTTDHNQDAWFVGYTPQIHDRGVDGEPVERARPDDERRRHHGVRRRPTPHASGRAFMTAATANLPPLDFTPPDESLWPRPQRHQRVRPQRPGLVGLFTASLDAIDGRRLLLRRRPAPRRPPPRRPGRRRSRHADRRRRALRRRRRRSGP